MPIISIISGGRFNMKYRRQAITIIVSVLFLISLAALSYGASATAVDTKAVKAATTAKPQGVPVSGSTQSIKPLQQALSLTAAMSSSDMLCSDIVNDINAIAKLAHQDLQKTLHSNGSGNDHISFPGTWELYYVSPRYRSYVQGCCSEGKSFSVQEQQAAGCAGSDTMTQCMNKLTKYCISQFKERNELRGKLIQSRDKANAVSVETKQLYEKLNHLMSIMP